MRLFFRARALQRESESEREFKSENLSETSSISREWDFPGKTKHKFFKNEERFSLNLSSFPLNARLRKRSLVTSPRMSVARSSSLDRFATTIHHHHQRRRKDSEFK